MAVLEEPGATGPTRVSKAFQMRAPYVRETQTTIDECSRSACFSFSGLQHVVAGDVNTWSNKSRSEVLDSLSSFLYLYHTHVGVTLILLKGDI